MNRFQVYFFLVNGSADVTRFAFLPQLCLLLGKEKIGWSPALLVARTLLVSLMCFIYFLLFSGKKLLVAPGISTRKKKLLVTSNNGISTSS